MPSANEKADVDAHAKLTRGADLQVPLPTNVGYRAAASSEVAIAGSVDGRQNSRKRVNPRLARTYAEIRNTDFGLRLGVKPAA